MAENEYWYGDLNPIAPPTFRRRTRPTSVLDAVHRAIQSNESIDSLNNTGPYKAIVLRVDDRSMIKMPPGNSWFSWFSAGESYPFHRIKARIPELHAMLPVPKEYGATKGSDATIIEMYPTFEANSDELDAPAVGDVVWVDFENKLNMTGPIFIGPVFGAPNVNPNGAMAPTATNYVALDGKLLVEREMGNAIITSQQPYVDYIVIDGVQHKIAVKVRHLNAKKAESMPFGYRARKAAKPKMIVVHWDAATSADACADALSRRGLATHFVIDNDGTILQLFDPVKSVTFHAGSVNEVSVGIDISNAVDIKFQNWYTSHGFPARPILDIKETLGRTLKESNNKYLGFYPVQIESTKKLLNLLCDKIGILKQSPAAKVAVPAVATGEYSGVVAHYHVNPGKWDVAGFPFEQMFVG